jgi:hypothetical protein
MRQVNPVQTDNGHTITIIALGLILVFAIFAGCMYIDPFINAGKTVATTANDVTDQQCKQACDNHYQILPPGCSCPKSPQPTVTTDSIAK